MKGEKIAAAGPGRRGRGADERAASSTLPGHDAPARPDRRPLARAAAPLQRGDVGRPGAEGAARRARLPGDEPRHGRTAAAGFTTIRDLGTEGAGYADVGIKQAIEKGIIPGPRMLVTTRAIVATGSYAPRGFAPELRIPQGAEEADGADAAHASSATRSAAGRTGSRCTPTPARPGQGAKPTFSLDELKLIVETAKDAGVPGVGPRDDEGGDAAGDAGRRRDDRARRRRRRRGVPADGEAQASPLPDAGGGRGDGPLRRLAAGHDPEPTELQSKRDELQGGAGGRA